MLFGIKTLATSIKRSSGFGRNNFMWLTALAAILSIIGSCSAIKCYKCTVTAEKYHSRDINSTITTLICSKFDESPEFIMECPYSTMCLKTISTLHLRSAEPLQTITRGCAQQKDTTQIFRNSQWQQEHSIQEVYQEGCNELKHNNLGTKVTHCYCRGNLCNSSQHIATTNTFLLFVTSFVIYIYNKIVKIIT